MSEGGVPHKKRTGIKDTPGYINPALLKASSTFISRATATHENKYDYSRVKYKGLSTQVEIVCPIHGVFLQRPDVHLKGSGCQACYNDRRGATLAKSQEDFIAECRERHNNFYDYSKTVYIRSTEKVEIICPKHGSFWQLANDHARGFGCNKCGIEETAKKLSISCVLSNEEFKDRAATKHNGKYSYENTDYVGGPCKVWITCKVHGDFYQRAHDHLFGGHGCPSCTNTGIQPEDPAFVYVLESASWVKVGITRNTPAERAYKINKGSPEVFSVVFSAPESGAVCRRIERLALNWLKIMTTQVGYRFDGSTETFVKIPVETVINKIKEFVKDIEDERYRREEHSTVSTDNV